MNKLFKGGKKVIAIDDNYYLVTDGYHGVCLTFHEQRERLKKNSTETEPFEYEDRWYHLTAGQALENYVKLSQKSSESIEDIVTNTKRILAILDDFKTTYKNW